MPSKAGAAVWLEELTAMSLRTEIVCILLHKAIEIINQIFKTSALPQLFQSVLESKLFLSNDRVFLLLGGRLRDFLFFLYFCNLFTYQQLALYCRISAQIKIT